MEAQRYPNDFDGIIAGAPALYQAPLNGEYETWNAVANLDPQGNPILPAEKLALIHAAAPECDGKDGLMDKSPPQSLYLKPKSLRCSNDAIEQTV